MTTHERWVDVEEVAAHLGVTKHSVYRWIERNAFPAHYAGRLLRFKLSEVDKWMGTGSRVNARPHRKGKGTRARRKRTRG